MELMLPKGTRDFLPEEKILREKIIRQLKEVFELYGFSPIETPAIERFEVLASKYAGGEEILKETFKLKDQGQRELGLKYDLTVPLARVIGMNPNLKMPFKRYQIEKVWRDGPITTSRYREFYQCDVDVVGSSSMMADAEILKITSTSLEKLGLEYEIKVNNRKILDGLMQDLGIREEYWNSILLSLDKIEKIEKKEVERELEEKGLEEKKIKALFEFCSIKGSNGEIIARAKKTVKSKEGIEGIKELEELLDYCKEFKVNNLYITYSLVRGLSYYTSTVFEAVLSKSKVKSSIAGGGRYDNMIGAFLEGSKEFPAVGIAFGLDRIYDALMEKGLKAEKTNTKIYVIPIGTEAEKKAIELAERMREKGINSDIDLLKRGISKNLDYASRQGIPFVALLGENELKEECLKLRDMKTGKEEKIKLNELEKLKKIIV
ncbi:MAG: histidine--tRNA ligase [Candidatus Diapherotrites archaeon]